MAGDELRELKRTARTQARHMLLKLNSKRRERAAFDACRLLRLSNIWTTCDCLLAYMALDAELDCAPAIQLALDYNKKVFIPKTLANNMIFFRILSGDGPFVKGPLGIREPAGGEFGTNRDVWKPKEGSSLVLTPGLLFDKDGGRLGRGGGFFDRFIRGFRSSGGDFAVARTLFIGYAYDEQVVEEVPKGSEDEDLDGVLSDRRFLRASR